MKVGEALVQAGKISAEQLQEALEIQLAEGSQGRLEDVLIQSGFVSASDILNAQGAQYHLNVIHHIDDEMIDASLIEKIPVDWVRKYKLLPLKDRNGIITAMAEPASLNKLEELSILLNQEVEGALAPEAEILRAIDQVYFEKKKVKSGLDAPEQTAKRKQAAFVRAEDLLRESDSTPVTKLMNRIILDAVRKKASDIHLESFENHLRVRYRVDGILYEQDAPPKELEQPLISRIKVMSRLDIAERRLPQDGMAKVRAGEREIDIRVSTVPAASGERVVLRLLNQATTLLPLKDLGMSDDMLDRFNLAKNMPNGIILVTGPTGSGKTTTLYAALQEMDTVHRNVMTIEDPIEYQMPKIGQIQVKPKIGLTFASGLRHILRQDPDVILVGEIRDKETAEIAVRSALTGHLVFSTLHTNDAVSAIIRLADMGIPPYLIAESVRAVVAQRLVRRLCPECRTETNISENDLNFLPPEQRKTYVHGKHYVPVGCNQCTQGYKGRVGIYELIVIGKAEQQEIRTTLSVGSMQDLSVKQSSSMAIDAADKISAGITSVEEVRRILASGPEHFVP